MSDVSLEPAPPVSIFRCTLGFILIGMAWGFTTPFIRRAARSHHPVSRSFLVKSRMRGNWICSRTFEAFFAALDFLRNPNYAIPLIINLTGSVWFFLLVGQAAESNNYRSESHCTYHKFSVIRLYCAGRLINC
ncbi:hypothetical protein GcC1_195036 [Golovinomyces cichoracearum]|uniref:Integral membrane protein n=1 Tax=Golovinomyces cichoracearum TaxID=62708 RepID=A0A420HGS2_9PEZI|nr:hypothetical protein GcC1_195036 [Golovinomyces cichoracearum]